jgi:hypothetical protein
MMRLTGTGQACKAHDAGARAKNAADTREPFARDVIGREFAECRVRFLLDS